METLHIDLYKDIIPVITGFIAMGWYLSHQTVKRLRKKILETRNGEIN